MSKKESIEQLRASIEKIDNDIFKLIAIRMDIAKCIGEIKIAEDLPIIDTLREKEMISKLQKSLSGEMDADHIAQIAKTLFRVSRSIQSD